VKGVKNVASVYIALLHYTAATQHRERTFHLYGAGRMMLSFKSAVMGKYKCIK